MSSSYVRAARAFSSPLVSPIRIRTTSPLCRHASRRAASTESASPASQTATSNIAFVAIPGAAVLLGLAGYLYMTDTRAAAHRYIVPPLIRTILPDAEDAHNYGTKILRVVYDLGAYPRERKTFPPMENDVLGQQLNNPIGISAGLDKHADIPDALFALGAGVVEVGGCTPLPQEGNPRPRVFRVPTLDGMVNRYGLNSKGADVMSIQLRDRLRKFARSKGFTEREVLDGEAGVPPGALIPGRMLAVQIAKNKETDEKDVTAVARDYVYCVRRLAPYADVLVVNVSSPNTPGLRDLQAVQPLSRILAAVVREAQATDRKTKPKVMVKVSPDEDEDAQLDGVVQAVWMSGVDGVIVGNTTKKRQGIVHPNVRLRPDEKTSLGETGGYSGPQMFERTLDLVGRYRKMLDGVYRTGNEKDPRLANSEQKVIFATGGITNGQQVARILDAGASVAMVYTGMVYGGAGTVTRLKGEMLAAREKREKR